MFTVCCSHVWSSRLIQVAQKTRLVSWIFPNKKIDDWKEEWMALYQNVNEVMVFYRTSDRTAFAACCSIRDTDFFGVV